MQINALLLEVTWYVPHLPCQAYGNDVFWPTVPRPSRPPIKERTPEPEPPRKSMCVTKKQPRNKCSVKEFLQFFFSFFFLFHCFGCIHTPHCPPAAGHLPVPSLSGRAVFVCRFVFIPSTRLMPFAWNGKHIQTEASQERIAVPIPPMPEQTDSTGRKNGRTGRRTERRVR